MERELNKLFNDTNYNKENVIIREIMMNQTWIFKLFWGVFIYDDQNLNTLHAASLTVSIMPRFVSCLIKLVINIINNL